MINKKRNIKQGFFRFYAMVEHWDAVLNGISMWGRIIRHYRK